MYNTITVQPNTDKQDSLSTHVLQSAIDKVAEKGGGTVNVPAGTYHTGTLELRSRVHLHLESGAVIRGSKNIEDYVQQSEGTILPEFPEVRCLFVGFDLEDVTFSGPGIVDGAGDDFINYNSPTFEDYFTADVFASMPESRRHEYVAENKQHRPTWIFYFSRCTRVRIRDLHVRDAARWTFHISDSRQVYFDGLSIDNDLRAANSDGIHLTGCSEALISNCVITSGDDCVAITTYDRKGSISSGIQVDNCILTSHSAGVRIGLGEEGLLEDVSVSNCTIRRSNRGVGIFAERGSLTRRIKISNVRIETRLIAGGWWGKGEPILIAPLGPKATIEDVTFSNLDLEGEQGIIATSDSTSRIRRLLFNNVHLTLTAGPMTPFSVGIVDVRPRDMWRRTMPPMLFEHVENLELDNVSVSVDNKARGYFASSIELNNCSGIELNRYREHVQEYSP